MEDIEDALREAEGLFGKDDPRAASYAASLLKEQGSTGALRAFVNQIKGSDAYQRGESLTNHMQVMEKDMPQLLVQSMHRHFLVRRRQHLTIVCQKMLSPLVPVI